MQAAVKAKVLKDRRASRVRFKIRGSNRNKRKRIFFHVTNKFLYAQLIDEISGKTLLSVTTRKKGEKSAKNLEAAKGLADAFAQQLQSKGVAADEGFLFDRAGKLYHGRVKAFADQLREKGLKL